MKFPKNCERAVVSLEKIRDRTGEVNIIIYIND